MAYLHCHNCDWSQDDFWDFKFHKYGYFHRWGYNPFSVFLSYVFSKDGYWKPRRITHEPYAAHDQGWGRNDPHSWWLILDCFLSMLRKLRRQVFWTEASYAKARDVAIVSGHTLGCPSCNANKLDID